MTSESDSQSFGKGSRLSALAQPFAVSRPSQQPYSTQFLSFPVSTASLSDINSCSTAFGHDQSSEIQPSSYYKPYPPSAYEPRPVYVSPPDSVFESLTVVESAQAGYFSGLVSSTNSSSIVDGFGKGGSPSSDAMAFNSLLKQVSQTSENGFAQAPVSRPSMTAVIDSFSLENVDSGFSDAVRNKKTVHNLVSITEAQMLCDATNGIACTDKVLVDQNDKRKGDEFVTSEAWDPLIVKTLLPQINCQKVFNSVNPNVDSAEASGPVENSLMVFDQNDSELDSPCWKGSRFYKSTSSISEPVNLQNSNNELEACNRLNPLAPQFLPSGLSQTIDIQKEYDADDFSLLKEALSPSVAGFSGDHGIVDSVKAGICLSEVSGVLGMQYSNNVHEQGIPYILPHQSYGCSLLESPRRDSNFMNLNHAGKVTDASNRLNPLAPQFLPATAKQDGYQHEKERDGDDSSSLQRTGSSFVAFSSGDGGLVVDSFKALRFSSEVSNITGSLSNASGLDIGNSLPTLSHKSSAFKHSHVCQPQPSLGEEYLSSNNQLVSGPNVPWSMKSTSATKNNCPNSVSFLVTEDVLNSSSSEVELFSNFTQTRWGSCKSSSSKIDGQLLLNMMHELSELLIQQHSKEFVSINENEHEIAQNVINNLCLYVRNTTPGNQKSESGELGTLYSPRQSADDSKHSTKNLQATRNSTKNLQVSRTKGKSVKHLETKGCCSIIFGEKAPDSFFRGNDEGREKANDITQMQVIANKALQGSYGTEEEMSPRALLFKSLWLKAEAALSFLNYQGCALNVNK